jgi:TonB family protein
LKVYLRRNGSGVERGDWFFCEPMAARQHGHRRDAADAGGRLNSPKGEFTLESGCPPDKETLMETRRRILSLLAVVVVPLAFTVRAGAQYALFVKQNDQFRPVAAMVENAPQIVADGKLVTVERSGSSWTYALGQTKTYAPYFITVRDLHIVPQGLELNPNGDPVNLSLAISAEFESAYSLDNVFLALEVKGTKNTVNTLIVHEVGGLKPGFPVSVHFFVPFYAAWGDCEATLHLFAGGPEVLHSKMLPAQVEHELDLMVQKKIEGVTNAPPQLFISPSPEYPAALPEKSASGSATIALRISPTGAVLDPVVKEATRPEFGESALKAIRQWRFLPKVKDGQPVETKIVLPLVFAPASAKAKE